MQRLEPNLKFEYSAVRVSIEIPLIALVSRRRCYLLTTKMSPGEFKRPSAQRSRGRGRVFSPGCACFWRCICISGEPCAWNGEFAPPTIQADAHVGRGYHRRKTHGPRRVAVEPDFGRDHGNGFRLALRANHRYPSEAQTCTTKHGTKSACGAHSIPVMHRFSTGNLPDSGPASPIGQHRTRRPAQIAISGCPTSSGARPPAFLFAKLVDAQKASGSPKRPRSIAARYTGSKN